MMTTAPLRIGNSNVNKRAKTSSDTHYISICENRTKEVGIAAISATRPVIHLRQFCDVQTYVNTITEIYVYQPIEVRISFSFDT